MRGFAVSAALLLVSALPTEAGLTKTICPYGGSWLSVYNLITISDLESNSDVEGKTFCGGNIASSSSANFAIHLTNVPATEVSLEVAGVFNPNGNGQSLQLNNGSGRITSGTIDRQNNIQFRVDGRTCNVNDGNEGADFALDATLPAKAAAIKEDLENYSSDLANLAPNNSYQAPTSQPGAFRFQVTNTDVNGVAIFHVGEGELFNNDKVQQIEFNGWESATAIVINVEGKSLEHKRNFVGSAPSENFRKKVLWNLYEAETLYAETQFNGALLAPYCVLNNRNTMDGSTAVLSLKGQSEIHDPMLDVGCDAAEFVEDDDDDEDGNDEECVDL